VSGTGQVYLMKPSGKHKHPITHNKSSSFDPAWSPDGKRIAFSGVRKGVSGIFTMTSKGKHLKKVATVGTTSAFGATWSPNGKKIAFQSNVDGDFEIYIAKARGKGRVKQLTHQSTNTFDGEPDFSPNGKFILFDEAGALMRMNTDGSHVKTLIGGPNISGGQYSPNGKKLVYTDGSGLMIAHADGKHAHALTMPSAGLADLSPTWAPKP
jgi:Tol biopolymer transport system component